MGVRQFLTMSRPGGEKMLMAQSKYWYNSRYVLSMLEKQVGGKGVPVEMVT